MAQLGDITIEVITDENKSFVNEITDKPVENGANIADHILHKPNEINLKFVITGDDAEDKRDTLLKMRDSDEVYEYIDVKKYRVYENMAILDVSFEDNVEVSNGFTGSMNLKQIQIVEQMTSIVTLGADPVTGSQPQSEAGDTENRSSSEEDADEDTVPESTLHKLQDGISSITGGE